MARIRSTTRRNCSTTDSSIILSPYPPRTRNAPVDTPRRQRLLRDAKAYAGKIRRKDLFKALDIPHTTGYRISKSQSPRRSEKLQNRGRKPILTFHERDAIEAVEDSNFRFAASTHCAVARAIGISQGSERAIQRNMKDHGVGIYRAAQRKFINKASVTARSNFAFERRYAKLEDFQRNRYADESHFATHLQRQAMVHRRRGLEHRIRSSKVQHRYKRRNQVWHVFGYIGWKFKSILHFYEGSGKGGRLTQEDYAVFLKDIVAKDWDANCVFIEDNDGSHGTRGKGPNRIRTLKDELGIICEPNPPESPDLNPIEHVWRIIKQALKNRPLIVDARELRLVIEEEWDKITLDEINKLISTMPDRIKAVNEEGGLPTRW